MYSQGYNLYKGIYLSKALTCMKFFLYKQELLFVKETDTFGHIVVWTTYTSHINHFTPQHTAFELSAACLSVFLELLPGSIPLTMLWHAWWTLDQTICMNVAYNYSTTMFRSIFAQNVQISGRKMKTWNPWVKHDGLHLLCKRPKMFMIQGTFQKMIFFSKIIHFYVNGFQSRV